MKKQTKWDFSPLFSGDNDPAIKKDRQAVEKENRQFVNKWKNRGDYLKNPGALKQALDEYEKLQRNYGISGKEGYYFHLRFTQNQNDPKLKAKYNQISDFEAKTISNIQFFELRIAKIDRKLQKKFLQDKQLKPYRHFLEKLFREAKYLLSEPEENILTLKSRFSHSDWVKMISGFLMKEEAILENGRKGVKSFAEITSLMSSSKKKTRDSAAKAFNRILEKHSDEAEAEINSILGNKKVDDELRGMARPDLSRHLADDIDSDVVDVLIDSVSGRFDLAQKYYKLKAKLMGVPKLKYHERNVPYGKLNKKYSYERAVGLVDRVFSRLDREFADIFRSFVKNGQIDVYPVKNKRDGAFCASGLVTQPVYILLNHADQLEDVLALAHESGHGINDELMKKQNALNFGLILSTGEVASTFMEDFVLEEILKEADDELKLAVMMNKLNGDISSIIRQTACYQFEQELHREFRKAGYLSKEEIGKMFRKHMAGYMGNAVEQSPGSENWWIYWSHIRRFFYVYSYASGFLISKSLQSSVKKDPSFINQVKEFLSAGLSDSPKNIFKKLGIDISDRSFWEKGLDEVERLLEETEKLAKKLK